MAEIENKSSRNSIPYSSIARFEDDIHRVFPKHPIPDIHDMGGTSFESGVRVLCKGKIWSDVIGKRLNVDELNSTFMSWVCYVPLNILKYYFPAHLMYAAILLSGGSIINYPMDIADALVLPPSLDPDILEDIDHELLMTCGDLSERWEPRVEFYKCMNPEERRCVAWFLEIYGQCNASEFTPRGLEYFKQNIEFWKNSSLPLSLFSEQE